MGDTAISWTDKTWNPIRGCTRVSAGCQHCYAERMAGRFAGPGQPYEGLAHKVGGEARWTGEVRFIEERLNDPLRWRTPCRVFVNSMSDLFHEEVTLTWLARIFDVMASATLGCGRRHQHDDECWTGEPHTFQILTKRPRRMHEVLTEQLPEFIFNRWPGDSPLSVAMSLGRGHWPLPNVHLGVSVENQVTARERIPTLLEIPAALRWISAEPLLGSIELDLWDFDRYLDWVVVGGESGPDYRPMDLEWLRCVVERCHAMLVPVWVKQDSGIRPGRQGRIPDDLWIQEGPTTKVPVPPGPSTSGSPIL